MQSFFRALDGHRVGYLLIGGQACVLHGAALFSEDVDIWLRPTAADLAGLKDALRDVEARVHKHTPPLELPYFRRGHGFHFTIPDEAAGGEAYLDVLGHPPRTIGFAHGLRRAEFMKTPWGRIAVAAIEDLVEMKKTRRPADYDVISNLARIRLDAAVRARLDGAAMRRVVRFVLDSAFRLDVLVDIFARAPEARKLAAGSRRASVRALAAEAPDGLPETPLPPKLEGRLIGQIASEVAALQQADIRCWSPIVDDLRELRKRGALLPEGSEP